MRKSLFYVIINLREKETVIRASNEKQNIITVGEDR